MAEGKRPDRDAAQAAEVQATAAGLAMESAGDTQEQEDAALDCGLLRKKSWILLMITAAASGIVSI